MKKLFFTLPALAMLTLFAYCTKENTPVLPHSDPGAVSIDRALCSVTIQSSGSIQICGFGQNNLNCQSCCGLSMKSSFAHTGTQTYSVELTTSNYAFITNTSGSAVTVRITTAGGTLNLNLHAGGCTGVTLDASTCAPTNSAPHC